MPLRIAFDLDGVLADMDSELVRRAERLFGEALTRRAEEARPRRPDSFHDRRWREPRRNRRGADHRC